VAVQVTGQSKSENDKANERGITTQASGTTENPQGCNHTEKDTTGGLACSPTTIQAGDDAAMAGGGQ